MLMRLCLLRHGETDWNLAGRLQGSMDIPLNERGVHQAHAAAEALAASRFSTVYSSDLQRAQMTAAILATAQSLAVRTEQRLRERRLGALEGLTREEAQDRYPEVFRRLKERYCDYLPPEGESVAAFSARVQRALSDLARSHPGETVLAVTHGGVLDVVYRLATDTPLDVARTWPLRNASVSWLVHEAGRWRIESWGDCAHLDQARGETQN